MDPVKKRIRDLLVLAAPGSGGTDAERDTARMMAERLMQKYALKEADIPERQIEAPRPQRPVPQPMREFTVVIRVNPGGWAGGTSSTAASFFDFEVG